MILVSLFVFPGCKKDQDMNTDNQAIITIESPLSGSIFTELDTVWLTYQISAKDDVHDYEVLVRNVTENKTVYNKPGHLHSNQISERVYFIPAVAKNAEMKLTVRNMDHNGTITEKSVQFTVNNRNDIDPPIISVNSPNKSMYDNGETVSIKGNITHQRPIDSVYVKITRNGYTVFEYTPTSNGANTCNIDTSHIISTNSHSDYVLYIFAKDAQNVSAAREVGFHVHP
jgi:uncharacterized protein YpmS